MSPQTKISKDSLGKYILDNSKLQSSLGEIVIVTTEDKIELSLMKHLGDVEKKRGWITPLGLLLTILLTFLTTDFKDWVGIPDDTWRAVFIIAGLIFFCWLIVATMDAWQSKSIKDVINEIKQSSVKLDENGAQHGVSGEASTTFSVVDAVYKTGKAAMNVTEQLNLLVTDGKLNTVASNDIAGDPDKGAKKILLVRYLHNGVVTEKTYDEGEAVSLP